MSPTRMLATTVAILAVIIGGYLLGRADGAGLERGRWEKMAAQTAARARQIESDGAAIAGEIRAENAAEQVRIVYRTNTVIERIPTYVTPAADANCPVPAGVVSVLNAAVDGADLPAVPGSAGGSVDAPSGVALSALTELAAYNFGVANQALAEARAWRKFYAEVAPLYGRPAPPP